MCYSGSSGNASCWHGARWDGWLTGADPVPRHRYGVLGGVDLGSGPPPERGECGANEVGGAPVGVELGDHGQVLA